MSEDEKLDQLVKLLMADLISALHKHGIRQVHVGGMMRLMGIDDTVAAEHDDERVELNDDFARYLKAANQPRSPDQTLH